MSSSTVCPSCGSSVQAALLGGLCPACVRRVALDADSEDDEPLTRPTPPGNRPSPPAGKWQPPSPEEMQAALPQYHFIALVGRGGMGAVYKASQVALDRMVAVKVLPADLCEVEDANFVERFKNEARMMARLKHPAIVDVYDFGETAAGLLYIAMEFVDGTDIAKMIVSQGRLPPDYALAITAHVCDALTYAHENGVIHRDIKPANILIDHTGLVKVADFGLAKQSDPTLSGLTKTNMAMGTPDYVAPEALITGMPLDGRADLYAVGVMLYQMLTGEVPRGLWMLPGQRLGADPRFDAIIAKAMQTDREMRYQSALEIRRDLDVIMTTPLVQKQDAPQPPAKRPPTAATGAQIIVNQQLSRPPPRRVEVPQKPARRRGGLVLSLLVGAALAAGGIGHYVGKSSSTAASAKAGLAPLDLKFGGHAYRMMEGRYTWEQARVEAERMGGHLAIVTSKEEREALAVAFGPFLTGQWWNAWLGGIRRSRETDWEWITGEPFFHGWYRGEPNANSFPAWVNLWRPTGLAPTPSWDDSNVLSHDSARRGYIIEWEAESPPKDAMLRRDTLIHAGHRYEFVPGPWSWDMAKAEAERRGGHLATLTSQAENEAVTAAFSPRLHSRYSSMWLGGYRVSKEADWWWVTGEAFKFSAWDPGEPNSNVFPAYLALWRRDAKVDTFGWVDGIYQGQDFSSWVGLLIEWESEELPPVVAAHSPVVSSNDQPFTNSLGMRFIPITRTERGTHVLFSIWETRQRDLATFAADTGWPQASRAPPVGMPAGPDHPAVNVNWSDAVGFCHWLTTRERKKGIIGPHDLYRLPTDFEWSIAAGLEEPPGHLPDRAHLIHRSYTWGTAWPPPAGAGNFADESARSLLAGGPVIELPYVKANLAPSFIEGYHDGFPTTAPVGSFAPSASGLYDLVGNVQEWCDDLFASPAAVSALRVLRGGSWVDGAFDDRLDASGRFDGQPLNGYTFRGFRPVLETR